MANEKHLEILKQGIDVWNRWREENPDIKPDLERADLTHADLRKANLQSANLWFADLRGANLQEADLTNAVLNNARLGEADLRKAKLFAAFLRETYLGDADLREADLSRAYLSIAYLAYAKLRSANLMWADFNGANLTKVDLRNANLRQVRFNGAKLTLANLSGADLRYSMLVYADLSLANIENCLIHGIAAWNVKLDHAKQSNLVITPDDEPTISVDNLEVAQFVYLLLNNDKIRDVINTLTTKAVLILGRFTSERKAVLDAIRRELRNHDLLPILFDFDKPATRDIHETVTTLARMARFVIADITDPKSIPQELVSIVEQLPSLPVQPILHEGSERWGMYDHIKRYPWVLAIHCYKDVDDLLNSLEEKVITPAEARAKELQQ